MGGGTRGIVIVSGRLLLVSVATESLLVLLLFDRVMVFLDASLTFLEVVTVFLDALLMFLDVVTVFLDVSSFEGVTLFLDVSLLEELGVSCVNG